MDENLRNRTEQKLRYAELHLNELRHMPRGRGHDFERSHQEAVFSQLLGAYDAFLLELNDILGCGCQPKHLSLEKLRNSLKKQGRSSNAVRTLYDLRKNQESWFRHLIDFRNTSTHRSGIPLGYYAGTGKTVFVHPETHEDLPNDATVTLSEWLANICSLTNELREIAMSEA